MIHGLRSRVPEISHFLQIGEFNPFVTMNGMVCLGFSMNCIDAESSDPSAKVQDLIQLLKRLPERVQVRFHLKAIPENSVPFSHSRERTVGEYGYLREVAYVFFEKNDRRLQSPNTSELIRRDQEGYENRISEFISTLPVQILHDLGAKALSSQEVKSLCCLGISEISENKNEKAKWKCIDAAYEKIGILRLEKQLGPSDLSMSGGLLDELSLAEIKRKLPIPFEFSVTLRKKEKKDSHNDLKRKLAQKTAAVGSRDVTAEPQAIAAREAIQKLILGNSDILEMEWLCILRRPSEELLASALVDVSRELSNLGDVVAETVGKAPSFAATFPGTKQHYTMDEFDDVAWAFLPIFSLGEPLPCDLVSPRRTLALHRENESLFFFDPFNRSYQGFNLIGNGLRGSGKSVFGNLILEALSHDPRVKVIQFDVGGSYLKHCERFNGNLIQATMDRPSGINPFRILTKMPESNDVIRTLSGFLAPLMVERTEKELPSIMEADLENALKAYAFSRPSSPSLQDFISRGYTIPRKILLERWTHGIFENVFKEDPDTIQRHDSWYTYFNLAHIHNAANPDYLKGVFGAIIARANIAMLEAGDARSGNGDILVLYSDESSFLTDLYFNYAKFTTSNFRKFGHGTIFIAQQFRSFEKVTASGEVDRGIIENSPIRFIFHVEGTDEEFAQKYELTPAQVARVRSLYRGKEFRECLLQTPSPVFGKEARVIRIRVTPHEYWEATSDKRDNEKLYGLMKAVPGLTLEEAIQCLSRGHEPELENGAS